MLKAVEYILFGLIICFVFILMDSYKFQPAMSQNEYAEIDRVYALMDQQQQFVQGYNNRTFSSELKITNTNVTTGYSELVGMVQELLDIQPDGYYGKSTVEAIEKFQQANQLHADGVLGEETLQKIIEQQLPLTENDLQGPSFIVENLQKQLEISTDGYFGESTLEELEKLKSQLQLQVVDGIDSKLFAYIVNNL